MEVIMGTLEKLCNGIQTVNAKQLEGALHELSTLSYSDKQASLVFPVIKEGLKNPEHNDKTLNQSFKAFEKITENKPELDFELLDIAYHTLSHPKIGASSRYSISNCLNTVFRRHPEQRLPFMKKCFEKAAQLSEGENQNKNLKYNFAYIASSTATTADRDIYDFLADGVKSNQIIKEHKASIALTMTEEASRHANNLEMVKSTFEFCKNLSSNTDMSLSLRNIYRTAIASDNSGIKKQGLEILDNIAEKPSRSELISLSNALSYGIEMVRAGKNKDFSEELKIMNKVFQNPNHTPVTHQVPDKHSSQGYYEVKGPHSLNQCYDALKQINIESPQTAKQVLECYASGMKNSSNTSDSLARAYQDLRYLTSIHPQYSEQIVDVVKQGLQNPKNDKDSLYACHSCLDMICKKSQTPEATQKALDCYEISMTHEANGSSSLNRGFEAINHLSSKYPARVAQITEQGMKHPANDKYSLERGQDIINQINDRNSLQNKSNIISRIKQSVR